MLFAKGPSRQKKGNGEGSSANPLRITNVPELWAPKFATVKLGKQVTNADTSKDHDTYLAMGNVAMLPQDMADLTAEGSEEFRYVNQLSQFLFISFSNN